MGGFEKGQKVRHPKIKGVMEGMGSPGLGAVSTSSGIIITSKSKRVNKTVCKYMLKGKTVTKSFNTSELELIVQV